MTPADEKTVILEVTFPKRQPTQPILNRLLASGIRSVNVLRGRVTGAGAWFRLELRGAATAVDAAVRRHQHGRAGVGRYSSKLA